MHRRHRVQFPPELTSLIVDEILRQTEDNYHDRRQRLLALSLVCRTFHYAARRALHSRLTFPIFRKAHPLSGEHRAQALLVYLLDNVRSLPPIREFSFIYDVRPQSYWKKGPHTRKENHADDASKPHINFLEKVPNPWQASCLSSLSWYALASAQLHTFTFGAHRHLYSYRHLSEYGYYMGSAMRGNIHLRVLKFRNVENFPREFVIGPFSSTRIRELSFENAIPDYTGHERTVQNNEEEGRNALQMFTKLRTLTMRGTEYEKFLKFLYSCLPVDTDYYTNPRRREKARPEPTRYFKNLRTLTVSMPKVPRGCPLKIKEDTPFANFMYGIWEAGMLENLTVEDFDGWRPKGGQSTSKPVCIFGMDRLKHLTMTCSADNIVMQWKLLKMQATIDGASYNSYTNEYEDPRIETITLNVWFDHLINAWDQSVPNAQQLLFNPRSPGWDPLDQALVNPRLRKLKKINLNIKTYFWREPDPAQAPMTRIENLTLTARQRVAGYLLPNAARRRGFSITFESIYTNMPLDTYLGHP